MIDASADAVLFVAVPVLAAIYVVAVIVSAAIETRRRRHLRQQYRTRGQ